MDKNWSHLKRGGKFLLYSSIVGALIAGCGGGPSSPATTNNPGNGTSCGSTSLCGVAAAGAPVTGIVYAYDSTGAQTPVATISATGAYTLDTTGLTSPYLITAIGVSNLKPTVLHSIATSTDLGKTVNVTPLTEVILSHAAGQPAQDIGVASLPAVASNVTASVTEINNIIAPLASAVNATISNPLTDAFSADGTGMDKVLDAINVIPAEQGGTIDVRLVGNNVSLGTVALPATAGQPATATANTAVTAAQLAAAQKLAGAIAEAKVCMASLTALYATSVPTAAQVTPFLDANFLGWGMNQATFAGYFTTPAPNGQGDIGLKFDVGAVADYDFTTPAMGASVTYPLPAPATFDGAGNVTAFWAQGGIGGMSLTQKMVKGAAYTGCPGGWQMSGNQRRVGDQEMKPWVHKDIASIGGTGTFGRNLGLRMAVQELQQFPGAVSVLISGPGFATANAGAAPTPVASISLVFGAPAEPALVISGQTHFMLNYCVDAAPGAFCFDESKAAPGSLYTWSVRNNANVVLYEFADQYLRGEVPYAEIVAQEASIFPVITAVTPLAADLVAQLNALPDGAALPAISTSFTMPALSNNGGVGWGQLRVSDANGALLQVFEANSSVSTGKWAPNPAATKVGAYANAAYVWRDVESNFLGYGVNTGFNF